MSSWGVAPVSAAIVAASFLMPCADFLGANPASRHLSPDQLPRLSFDVKGTPHAAPVRVFYAEGAGNVKVRTLTGNDRTIPVGPFRLIPGIITQVTLPARQQQPSSF